MIVSRFTAFTENFDLLLSNYLVFCSKYGCGSAFSARRPCNLGALATLAILVLREVSINTVFVRA